MVRESTAIQRPLYPKEEDVAYKKVVVEPNYVVQTKAETKGRFRISTIDFIEQNLALYNVLSQKRVDMLEEISSRFLSIADLLHKDKIYSVSHLMETISVDWNILLSYKLIKDNAAFFPPLEARERFPAHWEGSENHVKPLCFGHILLTRSNNNTRQNRLKERSREEHRRQYDGHRANQTVPDIHSQTSRDTHSPVCLIQPSSYP